MYERVSSKGGRGPRRAACGVGTGAQRGLRAPGRGSRAPLRTGFKARTGMRAPLWVMAGAVVTMLATAASGAIIATSAQVVTTVQELIDGAPASVSSDSAVFDGTAADLPIVASGALSSTELDGTVIAQAHSVSTFADPTRLATANPAEFGLEVGGFSNAESVAYTIFSTGTESRTVVFQRAGAGGAVAGEIAFRADGTQVVESTVFFSGAVIVWTRGEDDGEGDGDREDMLSALRVTVTTGGGTTVFDTRVTVTGDPGASDAVTTSGPIVAERVAMEDLIAEGVDASAAAVLADLAERANVTFVIVPRQQHRYSYTVTADEPLVLTAEFQANVRHAPRGTGAVAVWGRSFEMLAGLIEDAIPGIDGERVEMSMNDAAARRSVGAVARADETGTTTRATAPAMCGALGGGAPAMLLAGLGLSLVGRRGRRRMA